MIDDMSRERGTYLITERTARIERKEARIRILLTVLFAIVVNVLQTVVAVLVFFSLAFALITKQPPGQRDGSPCDESDAEIRKACLPSGAEG
jgi:hypothetical protein